MTLFLKTISTVLIAACCLFFKAGSGEAARIDVRKLSCGQVQKLVKTRRAVVMTFTNSSYDRVVSNGMYCFAGHIAEPFSTRTKDKERCHIGNVCKLPVYDDDEGLF